MRVLKQAPPSIAAFASSPGGRLRVRLRGESVPVSVNFRSSPRLAIEPTVRPLLWSRASRAVTDARAAGAVAATAATVASAMRSLRHVGLFISALPLGGDSRALARGVVQRHAKRRPIAGSV